jgi:fructose-1-phosphate kinase PfkB-like protein
MRITILEFAPCADTIYHIRRDAEEGYVAGGGRTVTLRSGSKLRPLAASVYAGGKATNVARVIDSLLDEDDSVEIELVVFRPDSPEGRYIHELQVGALDRVGVRPVIIGGKARFCIDLVDPTTDPADRVEFNISPRALWEAEALDVAIRFASEMETDLLLLAGNPPVLEPECQMAVDLYARIIEMVRPRVGIISIDVEKIALARCLQALHQPDIIKINHNEYLSVDGSLWDDFNGTLIVTEASGCRARARPGEETEVRGARVEKLYSTIGAGDAFHAGFTLARWVRGFDLVKACRYGQAAAAATVSSTEGTRGVTRQVTEQFFADLQTY